MLERDREKRGLDLLIVSVCTYFAMLKTFFVGCLTSLSQDLYVKE